MNPLAQIEVNPFEDDVVVEPRDVSYSVEGLNRGPLLKLLTQFSELEKGELPRVQIRGVKAQMVGSPESGYGKSHLLGQLFSTLGARATKIYLRPFQDPRRRWHSILLLTVQELERPVGPSAELPLQLESFAIGVLAHLAADFMAARKDGDFKGATATIAFLRAYPHDAFRHAKSNKSFNEWLKQLVEEPQLLSQLAGLMRKRGINLDGREQAWLRVLRAHVFTAPGSEERNASLKWLRAEPLEPEEMGTLRIATADNECRSDASTDEINDLSFRRLYGLCSLSSYYRPFLFCFDQTEFYSSEKELVTAFGNCIEALYASMPNQLTVITANTSNWTSDIAPHLLRSVQDRIGPEIRLEGIAMKAALELTIKRLSDVSAGNEGIALFLSERWLENLFEKLPEIGVRALLMRAAERFRALAKPSTPPKQKPGLADLFEAQVNEVLSKKALQQYNQDALMWLARSFIEGYIGVVVSKPQGRYFSTQWTFADRFVLFAFEGGDNSARWRAIANEAISLTERLKERTSITYVMRTPDLSKVPRSTWTKIKPMIEAAMSKGFRILELSLNDVCQLHAARELYSNALQGNIGYSGPEALEWLKEHFRPFFRRLSHPDIVPARSSDGPQERPTSATRDAPSLSEGQMGVVLSTVRQFRLIDIKSVLKQLGSDSLRDAVLRGVEAHPNLKAHPGPKTIFLQWRITA